jgi:hypothetical protein
MTTPSAFRVRRLPRPHDPAADRRKKRSTSPAQALDLALATAAQRAGLLLTFVADEFGTLVASSPTALDLTTLAAVTPIVGRGRAKANIRHNGAPVELAVRPIQVLDETLYVAGLGGELGPRSREVHGLAHATRRILG